MSPHEHRGKKLKAAHMSVDLSDGWFGLTKYVFVTGGVMSGIGKGIVAASIGKLLQVRNFKVTSVKIDPYLNVDAGTMNPYMHGEVFVTEDGGEIDMDVGTYERFLEVDIPKDQNITTGQIYLAVTNREREGQFLGRCVQIIPHITDEIKARITAVSRRAAVNVVMVEIGGTVGDIESLPYLEAARQMRLEEGFENILCVHVTLVPVLEVVGEQKTKPTQHSVQELRRIGIQPDAIVTRSKMPLEMSAKKKIALFCNVDEKAVFNSPDLESIYETPLILDAQGMGEYICNRLRLSSPLPDWSSWKQVVRRFLEPRYEVKIAICGKYAELADSYVSVNEALRHAGASTDSRIHMDWIGTETFEEDSVKLDLLSKYDGILVPGGFGARGTEGKIASIGYARIHDIPFLGICFGFQLAVIDLARSMGISNANSTEMDPDTPNPVIDFMPEQKEVMSKGATMRLGSHEIRITPNTIAHKLYRTEKIFERHRHRYEVNGAYMDKLVSGGIIFSGKSPDGKRMEILELLNAYFYLATQFHGEFKSRPTKPSPPYYGFVKASLDRKLGKSSPKF